MVIVIFIKLTEVPVLVVAQALFLCYDKPDAGKPVSYQGEGEH